MAFVYDLSQVAIASHFGRPEPRKQTWAAMQASHGLGVVAAALVARLGDGKFTGLASDCIGPPAHAMVDALQPGQVCRSVGSSGVRGGWGEGCWVPYIARVIAEGGKFTGGQPVVSIRTVNG